MVKRSARMQRLQPYFFAEVSAHIESLRAAGRDVIRLDIGAPDMPPAPDIVAALVSAAGRADT
ncbi:MAG: LL-diaminopimelate aminotransferase, partial [Anaerolineales bacterium]